MIRRASVRQYERILIKCKVQLITASFTIGCKSFDLMLGRVRVPGTWSRVRVVFPLALLFHHFSTPDAV